MRAGALVRTAERRREAPHAREAAARGAREGGEADLVRVRARARARARARVRVRVRVRARGSLPGARRQRGPRR